MSKRNLPEINAGSMADIAFLLLIFFLVTTTMEVDSGIMRKIPEKHQISEDFKIKDKNFLDVTINLKNEILVDNKLVSLDDLKQIAIDFIDNGGGFDKNKKNCDWCEGDQLANSSDHPSKAFIMLKADRKTNYTTYLTALNNLTAAYTTLRNRLSVKLYGKNYTHFMNTYKKTKAISAQEKIKNIREKYPLLLSE